MSFYKVIDKEGNYICDSLPLDVSSLFEGLSDTSKKVRVGGVEWRLGAYVRDGVVLHVATSELDLIRSTRLFARQIEFLFGCMGELKRIHQLVSNEAKTQANRMIHNLVTLNAHNLQEVYSIIPQEVMEDKKRGGWIKRVTECVESDCYDASLSLVRIAKNSLKMKVEISVYDSLSNGNAAPVMKRHSVHRVLMNVFYVFFPDFTDKEVLVNVAESTEFIDCDYETFQVALYHIVENAVKYIKHKTVLDVGISRGDDGKIQIVFSMNSLQIRQDEIDRIFDEGYSGHYSKKIMKSGSGIGLARVKELLSYNNAVLQVFPDFSTAKPFSTIQDVLYQDNVFKVVFH